ncbi:MAG: NAD(P)H-hydrate dehydratase [Thalassotalea sp.]
MVASVAQHAFTAKQVLEHEQAVAKSLAIDMYALMTAAGLAVFNEIVALGLRRKAILILLGKGNNGGDGLVVARLALAAGFKVQLVFLTPPTAFKGDALSAYQDLCQQCPKHPHLTLNLFYACEHTQQKPQGQDKNSPPSLSELVNSINSFAPELVVDAIFGIGFRGSLPPLSAQLITYVNQLPVIRIAVDVPSGVDATTGHVNNIAFVANITISFIAQKQGLYTGAAVNYSGEIKLKKLAMTAAFCQQVSSTVRLQTSLGLPQIPARKISAHKGVIGLLLAIGGNQGLPGAIQLASRAALRAGSSLVSVLSHKQSQQIIHATQAELMIAGSSVDDLQIAGVIEKAKMLIIGPGLGTNTWAQEIFSYALTRAIALNKWLVLDADGLNLLNNEFADGSAADVPQYYQCWVLTPHPGEAARLLNCSIADIEQDRFGAAWQISQKYGGICVLKGAGSLITDGQQTWINTSGNPSMASGGMGDVLSGIIAALLMQFDDKLSAVRLAVYIHGFIADGIVSEQGPIGLLASDIIAQLPRYLKPYTVK